MLDQFLKIVGHVLLELGNGFDAESVRDSFAFPRVFGAITGIEEAAVDGNEGIVILAEERDIYKYVGLEDLVSQITFLTNLRHASR